jgi:hypothetical protein
VKKSAKVILQVVCLVVLLSVAWYIGYFQAWHNSLSKQFASGQMMIVLNTHYLKVLRANNCLDPTIEKEMSGEVQAQLAFVMNSDHLRRQSIFWTLEAPNSWFASTGEWHSSLSVEELLRRADAAGVDTHIVRKLELSMEPVSRPTG